MIYAEVCFRSSEIRILRYSSFAIHVFAVVLKDFLPHLLVKAV